MGIDGGLNTPSRHPPHAVNSNQEKDIRLLSPCQQCPPKVSVIPMISTGVAEIIGRNSNHLFLIDFVRLQ